MATIEISQTEANALIAMEKVRVDNQTVKYPAFGGSVAIPLVSRNKREQFILDITKGKIDLLKGTYQNRSRQVIILVRLDFGGQPHRNPDGQEIASPHLHIFREGYGDKWAIAIPDNFSNPADFWQLLKDFMNYCNIIEPHYIERGLFI